MMSRIALISCVSKKKDYETFAYDLYISSLFKYALQYTQSINADRIYILSALYGLVEINERIKPYNKTLNGMTSKERKAWSQLVLEQMHMNELDLQNDEFIILAGNNYRQYLLEHIKNYQIPLKNLRIGEQLSYLKRSVSNE